MLNEKTIEANTNGQFDLAVPPLGVSVFMIGGGPALEPIKQAQKVLNAKDISVPKYFAGRPALNEYEWDTPVPPIGE